MIKLRISIPLKNTLLRGALFCIHSLNSIAFMCISFFLHSPSTWNTYSLYFLLRYISSRYKFIGQTLYCLALNCDHPFVHVKMPALTLKKKSSELPLYIEPFVNQGAKHTCWTHFHYIQSFFRLPFQILSPANVLANPLPVTFSIAAGSLKRCLLLLWQSSLSFINMHGESSWLISQIFFITPFANKTCRRNCMQTDKTKPIWLTLQYVSQHPWQNKSRSRPGTGNWAVYTMSVHVCVSLWVNMRSHPAWDWIQLLIVTGDKSADTKHVITTSCALEQPPQNFLSPISMSISHSPLGVRHS